MSDLVIKVLLIAAVLGIIFLLVRPTRSQSSLALRRISMFLTLCAAILAITFPHLFNSVARAIGVQSGPNLLVYLLFIVVLAQSVTSFRKDAAANEKLTSLARKVALMEAQIDADAKDDASDLHH